MKTDPTSGSDAQPDLIVKLKAPPFKCPETFEVQGGTTDCERTDEHGHVDHHWSDVTVEW